MYIHTHGQGELLGAVDTSCTHCRSIYAGEVDALALHFGGPTSPPTIDEMVGQHWSYTASPYLSRPGLDREVGRSVM